MRAELVLDAKARLGECPTWSQAEQALYWIDIKEPALHRFDPVTCEDRRWPVPAEIGAFALCRSGRLLAALRTGLVSLDLAEGSSRFVAPPPYDPLRQRFNDGKCDAAGRFWVGVMSEPLEEGTPRTSGRLHRFDMASGFTATELRATTSNGIGWSPDQSLFYFADSDQQVIWSHPFDVATGTVGEPELFVRFEASRPDGAAVDVEGGYWTALYGEGRIVRILPDGRFDREVRVPTSQPTMCVFGGPALDTLFITTAADELDGSEPMAGGLFRCEVGVRGLAPHLFAD